MNATRGMRDPVFQLDGSEQSMLSLAYIQMLVVKGLLYFATGKGRHGFVPVPAMIAAAIVKAIYKNAYGIMPHFLPQNWLDNRYLYYPREIFDEGFWWDQETISVAQKEMLAVPGVPEAMRVVVATLISENTSVLCPNGLMDVRMASWWPMRPCGSHRDNLRVRLTRENEAEAACGLERLGAENAKWCETIGTIMIGCMDTTLIDGRRGECHPSL